MNGILFYLLLLSRESYALSSPSSRGDIRRIWLGLIILITWEINYQRVKIFFARVNLEFDNQFGWYTWRHQYIKNVIVVFSGILISG